jgi:hypothetical protein
MVDQQIDSQKTVPEDADVKMRDEPAEEEFTITKYESVDDLFGHVYGIERTLLIDQQDDTLLNLIEKIALIPENKLVLVEPMTITKSQT